MNIPTAEEWINQQFSKQFINDDIYCSKEGFKENMILFAKTRFYKLIYTKKKMII